MVLYPSAWLPYFNSPDDDNTTELNPSTCEYCSYTLVLPPSAWEQSFKADVEKPSACDHWPNADVKFPSFARNHHSLETV